MSLAKGLKSIEERLDKAAAASAAAASSVRWLKLEDGQSVKIRFVSELDADSPHYDDKRGLAVVVDEHQNPKDYKRKAACTMESEGRCWACETNRNSGEKGWWPRMRFYTTVLVDDGTNAPYVAVWSMGVKRSATFNTIREYFKDSGSISNLTWRLRRDGTGTDTTYTLFPLKEDGEPFDWSNVDVIPVESAVKEVPYAEQEQFYLGFDNPATSATTDW